MKKILPLLLFVIITLTKINAQSRLWGVCKGGGSSGSGTIFATDSSENIFQVEYNCLYALSEVPVAGLCLANNNIFYGITEPGHLNHGCGIFTYNPANGHCSFIHSFFDSTYFGEEAWGKMLNASDGNLYGLCANGGANGYGSSYQINPSTNIFTDIYDFDNTNGSSPYGGLIQLADGKFYGVTMSGGANNKGVVFSYDATTFVYTNLYSFNTLSGANPFYLNLLQANNGKLYGTAKTGGANNYGVLFSYDITSNTYVDIYDFDLINGGFPYAGLIQATDGNLYGTADSGGVNNKGVLFRYNITTSAYAKLVDFNGINGAHPHRGLIQASNGKLYGTTYNGGIQDIGVAFSYNISTSVFTKLNDFLMTLTSGYSPNCELTETSIDLSLKENANNNSINIFPNPATSLFAVSSEATKIKEIKVFNVLGCEILKQVQNDRSVTIDVSGWTKGMYFVEVRTEKGVVRRRFVKE